jgi:DNA-binding transcriptional ArsR family regulator
MSSVHVQSGPATDAKRTIFDGSNLELVNFTYCAGVLRGRDSHRPQRDRDMQTERTRSSFRLPHGEMKAHAADAARLLRVLANETRLLILCLLSDGERSVGELNEEVDLSQSALSQHLAVLRAENLVQTRRAGQTIFYALTDGPAVAIIERLHAIYCRPARGLRTRRR